jgi:hypothetical protein
LFSKKGRHTIFMIGDSLAKRVEDSGYTQSWIERISAVGRLGRNGNCADAARLPSFFVIGPPRTGTTWLYEILKDRAILPAPTKETRFFDKHFHRGIDWYRAHFGHAAQDRQIGEIAPTYFASVEASQRIARMLPPSKVVCVFRHPVERVISLYKLKRAYGLIPWNFEQAMERDPEMLGSSRYATNLRIWQRALGTNQVMAMFYDDLCDKPQKFLDTLVDFIDVPRFVLNPSQTALIHSSETMTHPRNYHRTRSATTMADWFKARRLDRVVAAVRDSPLRKLFLGGGSPFGDFPRETSLRLYDIFRPEVEDLEAMINRDLSAWKCFAEEALTVSQSV